MQLLSGRQPTWYISSGSHASDKERLAVIKKDTYNGAHSASLFLSNNTTQFFAQPIADYSARGDFGNRSFFIYHGMAPVAEVRLCLTVFCFASCNDHGCMHGSLYALE
jgi:hypothetical protein